MKRIEAIVATEKIGEVNDALKKVGVGGLTIADGKGRGLGPREQISTGRGTGYHIPAFHSRSSVMTVVDDSKVKDVVDAIVKAASTGSPGDGKIFVTAVEECVDIGTKKRGTSVI